MMRLSRTALLLAFALAAGARASQAQTIPSPYEYVETTQAVGVFGGWLITDADVSLTDSTSLPLGPQSGPVFGVRYQVRAAGPLSVDASVAVSPTDRRLFQAVLDEDSVFASATEVGTGSSTLLMADVGLRFYLTGPRTWNGLAPFVHGMGGVVGDIQGTLDEEEEGVRESARFRFGPSFAVGAGLGTDWFPVRNASIRVEATGRLWRMKTPSGFLQVRTAERSEWNPVLGISVGGAFHF